jgi:N-acetylmuramoyl-L-alanine amidase
MGPDKTDELITYLRNRVFPHEQFYARCHYLYTRAFDSYSNSVLEGTNYGVKYCENGVRPNMSSAKSTKVMVDQDLDKSAITSKKTADALFKTPLHTSTATSKSIVRVAESHLQKEMAEVENYSSIRVKDNEFWVLRSTTLG